MKRTRRGGKQIGIKWFMSRPYMRSESSGGLRKIGGVRV